MSNEPKTDFASPNHVVSDPDPDERGNVMLAVTFKGGRMISLGFNSN